VSALLDLQEPTDILEHAHPHQDQFALIVEPCGAEVGWIDEKGGTQRHVLTGRHLWVVPAGVRHFVCWRRTAPLITLFAELPFVAGFVPQPLTTAGIFDLTHLEYLDHQIRQTNLTFQKLCYRDDRANGFYIEGLATVLVTHLLQALYRRQSAPVIRRLGLSGPALDRVVRHIDEHLGDELGIDDLAAVARLSRTHFLRLFKRSLGRTPLDYVMRCRVAKACELLERTDGKEKDIAPACGFVDQGHMARQFRRVLGKTPSGFRAEKR
jgi:AraC family transcriptional regulator